MWILFKNKGAALGRPAVAVGVGDFSILITYIVIRDFLGHKPHAL